MEEPKAEIGIIGGTGVYNPDMLKESTEIKVKTPYGEPSDSITLGEFCGRRVAFLPRHGRNHKTPPHSINYRANIWAMKELGVTRILAPAAVGSLQEKMAPGDIAIPDQFIDRTSGRKSSFYDNGQVCHISVADPFCDELREIVAEVCERNGSRFHESATYVCVEGPRFSTRAESRLFRQWGADVIGMTLFPEVALAREAQICYCTIATVTDYDVWADKPVSIEEVVCVLKENAAKTQRILKDVVPLVPKERTCGCKDALKGALI